MANVTTSDPTSPCQCRLGQDGWGKMAGARWLGQDGWGKMAGVRWLGLVWFYLAAQQSPYWGGVTVCHHRRCGYHNRPQVTRASLPACTAGVWQRQDVVLPSGHPHFCCGNPPAAAHGQGPLCSQGRCTASHCRSRRESRQRSTPSYTTSISRVIASKGESSQAQERRGAAWHVSWLLEHRVQLHDTHGELGGRERSTAGVG